MSTLCTLTGQVNGVNNDKYNTYYIPGMGDIISAFFFLKSSTDLSVYLERIETSLTGTVKCSVRPNARVGLIDYENNILGYYGTLNSSGQLTLSSPVSVNIQHSTIVANANLFQSLRIKAYNTKDDALILDSGTYNNQWIVKYYFNIPDICVQNAKIRGWGTSMPTDLIIAYSFFSGQRVPLVSWTPQANAKVQPIALPVIISGGSTETVILGSANNKLLNTDDNSLYTSYYQHRDFLL